MGTSEKGDKWILRRLFEESGRYRSDNYLCSRIDDG